MYILNWFETNDGKSMIPFHVHQKHCCDQRKLDWTVDL